MNKTVMTVAIAAVAAAALAGTASVAAAAPAHPAGQRASWPGVIAYEADNGSTWTLADRTGAGGRVSSTGPTIQHVKFSAESMTGRR